MSWLHSAYAVFMHMQDASLKALSTVMLPKLYIVNHLETRCGGVTIFGFLVEV
jgi:hypothetical protein